MKKVWKNRNVLIFHFEMTCLKIIFIFVFEFSLFHSELEYKVQSPLGYQGNTDQAHSRVCRAVACSFPAAHASSQIHLISVWQVLVDWLSFLPEHISLLDFLKVLTQQVSVIIKSQAWYFSVWLEMYPVCFESCRRLVPGWILSKPQVASQRCCVCCWQGSHSGSLALHGSYPGNALIQQISNSTSDSGAVRAMPESPLLLNCSANERLHRSYRSDKAAEETSLSL